MGSVGVGMGFSFQEKFYMYLLTFLHLPYRWGGNDSLGGFDCSGAVMVWLRYLGIAPDMRLNSQGIYNYYSNRPSTSERGMGSLCFYGKSRDEITHVAMMVDKYRVIHFRGGDRFTTDLTEARARGACCTIDHFTYRRDLVAVVKPNLPWSKVWTKN